MKSVLSVVDYGIFKIVSQIAVAIIFNNRPIKHHPQNDNVHLLASALHFLVRRLIYTAQFLKYELIAKTNILAE